MNYCHVTLLCHRGCRDKIDKSECTSISSRPSVMCWVKKKYSRVCFTCVFSYRDCELTNLHLIFPLGYKKREREKEREVRDNRNTKIVYYYVTASFPLIGEMYNTRKNLQN